MTISMLRLNPQRFLNSSFLKAKYHIVPLSQIEDLSLTSRCIHYQYANKASHLQASSSHQIPKIQTPSGVTADPKLLELLDRWQKSLLQLLNQAKQLFSMQDGANKYSIDFCGKLTAQSYLVQKKVFDWSLSIFTVKDLDLFYAGACFW